MRDDEKEILRSFEKIDWVEAAEYYRCLHPAWRTNMLRDHLRPQRWNLLHRNVLTASGLSGRDGMDVPRGNDRLAPTVACGGTGFLKIGPAI